jgi:YbgC/YbaW family acyl-CoA thioester hydrolase
MQTRSPIATFTNRRRVSMVDTDASGTVHLGAYIRMMEETEYAFLRSRGLSVVLTDAKGILGFPRLEASIDVAHAVRFDDEVQIELSLIEVDGKQVIYEFAIENVGGASDATQVATGRFRVVCCRFPNGESPYAILTPLHVIEALRSRQES